MTSTRPLPNRRQRETTPEMEAKIEAFAKEAETLQGGIEPAGMVKAPSSAGGGDKSVRAVKPPKSRSYTFRMTEETLDKLRAAADEQERSIQWVFDRVLLPHLDK